MISLSTLDCKVLIRKEPEILMDLDRNAGHCSDSESGIASDCSSNDEDKIHVGSEYQVNVPNNVLDKSFCYLELDKSDPVWLPPKMNFSFAKLNQYVSDAHSLYNICEEQALSLLHNSCYDLNRAEQTLTQTKRYADTLDKWSHQEREHFINAYNYHGKKFKVIQAALPNKSISDLVDYYYTWKKTRNSVSLITQYCNVLELQHSNSLAEESSHIPQSPPIPLEVHETVDQSPHLSRQNPALGVTIDSIEPSLLDQELVLSSENPVINMPETCTNPVITDLPSLPSSDPPGTPNVLNSMDVPVDNVLHVKDLVPEHLNYLLECLESNDEHFDVMKTDIDKDVSQSSQTNPMFARCTKCKNILDTWTFSSTSGIVCYSCKPTGAGGNTEEVVSKQIGSTIDVEETHEEVDMSALNRLNQVCKQTCDVSKVNQGVRIEMCSGKRHKLKVVPRGLYFNIVDYIEIATNKQEYVDDLFKQMDRDVSNLVKRVRSNNISIDTMLDQIESKLPLEKYRSSNNNNNDINSATDIVKEDKNAVLWTDTEIFLALQGFLKYGMDFQTIAEILETKTNKQVAYFYQLNKAYYNLDVLINEHNSNKRAANIKDSDPENMDVDIYK